MFITIILLIHFPILQINLPNILPKLRWNERLLCEQSFGGHTSLLRNTVFQNGCQTDSEKMRELTIVNATFISPLGLSRSYLQDSGLQLGAALTTPSAVPRVISLILVPSNSSQMAVPQFRPGSPPPTSLPIHCTLNRSLVALCSDPLTASL